MKKNRRIQSFALLILAAVLLAVIAVLGSFWQEAASIKITGVTEDTSSFVNM